MQRLAPMRRRARALLLAVTVTARVLDTQRAVSLPVDSERQRVVTVDASARAVKRALRRYDARSHAYCGAVSPRPTGGTSGTRTAWAPRCCARTSLRRCCSRTR